MKMIKTTQLFQVINPEFLLRKSTDPLSSTEFVGQFELFDLSSS